MPMQQNPKGTKDIQSDQYYARDYIAKKILHVMECYGFRQVITPAFENIEVFTAKAGIEILDQIYEFRDKGGRHLALRSDITASIARLITPQLRGAVKPVKISSYDRVWRYERPQSGRFREFYQINAEMFGVDSSMADAEIIAMFCDAYDAIGLTDYQIHIGHRQLLEDFVATLDGNIIDIESIIRLIDKAPKLSKENFYAEIVKLGLSDAGWVDLQNFMSLKGPITTTIQEAINLYTSRSQLVPSLNSLKEIVEKIELYGIGPKCMINLSIARGSDYYTGIIFECVYNTDVVGSIGGGGRYDNLIETYGGPPTPAIGWSVGFERVMILLNSLEDFNASSYIPSLDYYVLAVSESCVEKAIFITQQLRHLNRSVELDLYGRNLKQQLSRATKMGALKAIIIGPEELSANQVVMRNLSQHTEELVDINRLLANGE